MKNRGAESSVAAQNKIALAVKVSVEIQGRYFQDVALTAEYVTDVSDHRGRASLALSEKYW
jgi:hypothetical protein